MENPIVWLIGVVFFASYLVLNVLEKILTEIKTTRMLLERTHNELLAQTNSIDLIRSVLMQQENERRQEEAHARFGEVLTQVNNVFDDK